MQGAGKNYMEELWVGIHGDMSHLKRSLDSSQQSVKGFAGDLEQMSSTLNAVSMGLIGIATSAGAMVGITMNVFGDFQQALANTQSVLGATEEQFQEIMNTAREMGRTTIFTAQQSAEAMYYLASAGYDTEQTISSLESTLNLAAATQYNLAETTRIVVSTMNQFVIAAENADRVSNVFAATISSSQATMNRLAESMKFVGPIAKSLNIPLEQITASLGLLFNAGLQASQAGTNMRMALVRLQKPTRQAKEAIKDLGLSFNAINPQTHDLVEILEEFERVGADAATAGDELAKIFGVRAVVAIQNLIRQGSPALVEMQDKITGTNKATEMARIQIDTFRGAMRLLLSVIQETAIMFGKRLEPVITEVVKTLRDAVKWFNSMPPLLADIIAYGTLAITAFGGIAGGLGLIVSHLPAIIGGIKSVIAVFTAGITTMGTFAPAIAAVVAALGLLGKYLYDTLTAERRAKEEMQDHVDSMQDFISNQRKVSEEAKAAAKEYLKLAEKSQPSRKEQERMKKIVLDLKNEYPGLIDATGDYTDMVEDMHNVLDAANEELKKITELERELAKVKISLKLAKAYEDLRDFRDELEELSTKGYKPVTIETEPASQLMDTLDGLAKKAGYYQAEMTIVQTDMEQIRKHAYELAKTEEGRVKLRKDIVNLQAQATEYHGEIAELQAKQNDTTKELTDWEKSRLPHIERLMKDYELISKAYLDILSANMQVADQELLINRFLEEQERLRKDIGDAGDGGDGDGGKPDPKEYEDIWKEIKQLQLDAQASQLKIMENNLAESYVRQKQMAREQAKFERDQLEFNLQKKIEWAENTKIEEDRLTEYLKNLWQEYTDKSLEIRSELNKKIRDLSAQEIEDRKKLEKMYWNWVVNTQESGLEKYKEYLEKKLENAKEGFEDWYKIQANLMQVEETLYRRRVRNSRMLANAISQSAEAVGEAMVKGAQGVADAWKNALKEAVRMFADYYKNLLKMEMALAIAAQQWGKVIATGAGIAAISAAETAAISAIERAQTGAMIKKSGLLNVHKGEMVVPATVVRQPRDQYERAARKEPVVDTDRDIEKTIEQKPVFILNNPIVDNQEFWDTVIEEHYEQAIDNLKKRR